jgi:hypothetical protein
VTDKRKAPACRELGLGGGNRKSISNYKILFPPPKSKRFHSFFGENKVSSESKSALRQIVEKQQPQLFWDPADPTKTRLSAKVVHLTAPPEAPKRSSNRKRKSPLAAQWNDVFLDEVVPFEAFRELSPVARSLLLDLFNVARCIGTETPIGSSARMAADMLKMGKSTGAEAISELEASGFIVSFVRGLQHRKERVASNWRLTFLPFKGTPPTRDFVRRHFKAKDMQGFEETKAKFFNEKIEAMWLENQAKYADEPADFDES